MGVRSSLWIVGYGDARKRGRQSPHVGGRSTDQEEEIVLTKIVRAETASAGSGNDVRTRGGTKMRLPLAVGIAMIAAVVATTGAFGGSSGDNMLTGTAARAAAAKPTLVVVVVGKGRVTSNPAGISCPGKCSATFASGTRVLLTPTAKKGSRFLRWGGNCTGRGACRVKVTALSAVAA